MVGLSEINTLSNCLKLFIHNQAFYDAREYTAEYWLPTTGAVYLSANNTVQRAQTQST